MLSRGSYAAGHFEFLVDGHEPTAYVKAVEGGWSRTQLGNEREQHKVSTVEIDPIVVELGLTGAKDMLRWVQQSWNRTHDRRNGQISYADFDQRTRFEHEFFGALLTEVAFPTLDGASKDGGYLKCTLQPERAATRCRGASPGPRLRGTMSPMQKMWSPSAFRINIDGVDGLQYVNKLDGFKVTLATKKMHSGEARMPELVPVQINFPKLTGTISMRYAEGLIKWQQDYVRSQDGPGTRESQARRNGSIEFLTPDRKQTMFTIKLTDVAPLYVAATPAKANEEQVRRVQFELYVRSMSIEGGVIPL